MALMFIPCSTPLTATSSSFFARILLHQFFPRSPVRWRPRRALCVTNGAAMMTGASRGKPKELVLGAPSVPVEKGKYSYEVETLINKLSSLPPRGSIARCLESFRGRLSLSDFALVFAEFARRADWQRSLRLFKYMQRQSWCRPDERLHAILIGVLGRERLLDKALEVFSEMPEHAVPRTALSYTALIAAYARNGDHDAALRFLEQMKAERVAPTALTYNTALGAAARGGLPWDALLGLFAEMRHGGVRPDLATYNTLLVAAGARGLADEAEMVLRTMLEAGIAPDSATHAALVDAFGRLGRLRHVAKLLDEMAVAGHLPDASAYNVLIEAHAHAGETREAIAVLRQMQSAGCTPNAATYSILLNLFGKKGRYEDVRELFLEMKVGNTEPDTSTYNILIQVFGEGGYFKEVVTLFNDMVDENIEPNMETYESLLLACGKGGLYQDAKAVFSYMNSRGIVPSSKAYTGVVEAYGQAALYEEALVAFNTMHEIGSMPTVETYNSLVHMFARGGLFKEAQAILTRMNDAEIQRNEYSFNGLIEAFCQGGQLEDALRAYVEMQKSRCIPNERTLEAVLSVYCTAGLVDESREQFQEIQSVGVMPSVMAYCNLLSVYAKNDRWEDVNQLLEDMITNRVSNMHQVIGSMIKGDYDDESNWQMVEFVFDKFNSEGCGFGFRFYNALLEALWWLGQKARAAQVLQEATRRALFPELFRQSKLVWSVDVHRMSVGGALTAISVWLNEIYERLNRGDDLPHLATVVVVRGEMEKSSVVRGLPVAKAAYSFLKENVSPSFYFPGWNKGRIVCHRSQLKRLSSVIQPLSTDEPIKDLVPLTNSAFPLPGTRLHTVEDGSDDEHSSDEAVSTEAAEFMTMAAS